MKHPCTIPITLLLASLSLYAQTNPAGQLPKALALDQQGKFAGAANLAKSIVDSDQLHGDALGRAYIILGFAYRGDQKFIEAQAAFEDALRVLEKEPDDERDYAAALSNFAGLYADLGQLQAAGTMWQKALALSQKEGNPAAIVQSLTNLARMALSQKRLHQAEEYLNRASAEIKVAHELDESDFVVFFETQAWLALEQDNPSAAITGYQHALEICAHFRGPQHWLTGWERTLLGYAYARSGDLSQALAVMREGLAILRQTLAPNNPNYFSAEMAYSQVLEQSGSGAEAARLKASAERDSKDFRDRQCAGCTINVAGFR